MSFGVYLIHCNPIIMDKLIEGAFAWIANEPVYFAVPLVAGIAFAIFAGCLMIDKVRLMLFRLCKVNRLCAWIEELTAKIINKILKLLHCA